MAAAAAAALIDLRGRCSSAVPAHGAVTLGGYARACFNVTTARPNDISLHDDNDDDEDDGPTCNPVAVRKRCVYVCSAKCARLCVQSSAKVLRYARAPPCDSVGVAVARLTPPVVPGWGGGEKGALASSKTIYQLPTRSRRPTSVVCEPTLSLPPPHTLFVSFRFHVVVFIVVSLARVRVNVCVFFFIFLVPYFRFNRFRPTGGDTIALQQRVTPA